MIGLILQELPLKLSNPDPAKSELSSSCPTLPNHLADLECYFSLSIMVVTIVRLIIYQRFFVVVNQLFQVSHFFGLVKMVPEDHMVLLFWKFPFIFALIRWGEINIL